MAVKKPLISIVTPVFNEAETVDSFYTAVKKELEILSEKYDYEIIFTDNRSTDNTFQKLQAIAVKNARVRIARFSRNFGYQKSIFTGYCLADGDCAIEIDCDLQDPPCLIHDFIAKWNEGYQVIYGVRLDREEGWVMIKMRECFYRLINFLSEDPLPLNVGDFRLVDRKVLNQIKKCYDASPYLRGAIANFGFNQTGIPYKRAQRVKGHSKFNASALWGLAVDGIVNHSIVPLRLATFIGFLIAIFLIFYFGGLWILTLTVGMEWPRGLATSYVLMLIGISLNALFLGIIGEYIGRIYRQVKMQPVTIIDQMVNFESHNHLPPQGDLRIF